MCGIAGQARSDGQPVDRLLVERMCRAIEHRGPDARGLHMADQVGLGIQRLRVIDLNTGDQPIFNEDRSVAVVLNGEIYNYRELRERLCQSGHRFRTASDTEVLVHLYEERGPELVHELRGMFAFALWDASRQQLLLARDRVGKKPLYYAHRDGALSFASELNALMRDSRLPRTVDVRALDAYLAYRYVPAPMSVFETVRKLPPASVLIFREGAIKIDQYWRLDYASKCAIGGDRELLEELRGRIKSAVRRRMIADVSLGAFLSGGIDSSAVVAAMAEQSTNPVKTFAIGFEEQEVNELPQARKIAELFGTDHHEFVVRPNAVDDIPRLVRHYGEPFSNASAIPSFYLAETAREHVTVALNGDGGDEAFAGYSRYASMAMLDRFDPVPQVFRRAAGGLGRHLPSRGRIDSWPERIRRASTAVALSPADRYFGYISRFGGLDRDALYTREFKSRLAPFDCADLIRRRWEQGTAQSVVDRVLEVDTQTYLPGDHLFKMDTATMAYGLEARSPLLDHELLEFAASLPPRLKIRGTHLKVGLRAALRGWIPDQILDAPKRGFRLPIHDWFRGDLKSFAPEILLSPEARNRGYFRDSYVRELLDRHQAGVEDCSRGIWTLLVFELWNREFVDAPVLR